MSRVQTKVSSILWVILQKEEGSILLVTLKKKKTILWVTFKEGSILWVIKKKKTQIEKRFIKEAHFYESFTKSSILWVIVEKEDFDFLSLFFWHKVQLFESFFFFRISFLWVISEKKVQFFESIKFLKKKKLNHLRQRGKSFNSLRRKRKRVQFSASYSKKKVSILCVIFKEKGFNSLSHIQKKKINSLCHAQKIQLFELHSQKVQFFESYKKNVQFFESFFVKRVQFFEFFFWRKSHIKKWVRFFESYSKRVQFFESFQKEEGSILLVTLKKKTKGVTFFEGQLFESEKKFNSFESS